MIVIKACNLSMLLRYITFLYVQESYFILKYDGDAVSTAKEKGDEISEDGVEEAFDVSVHCYYMESFATYMSIRAHFLC